MASQEPEATDEDVGRPEIVKSERKIEFAGLTRFDDAALPEDVWGHGSSIRWWAEERWRGEDDEGDDVVLPEDLPGLNTTIRDLPRASLAEAAWVHPVTGDVVRTGKHNAVINPQVAEAMTERDDVSQDGFVFGEPDEAAGVSGQFVGSKDEAEEVWGEDEWKENVIGDDALYNIPTDDYVVVNPAEFLSPLAEVIQDRDLDDAVFGEFRLFRSGGKVSADVMFNGQHVDVPGREGDKKPIVVGFQVDWDHFGGTSIHATGMAMNWECINAFRAITDEVLVKHTGDLDNRQFEVGDKKVDDWYGVWDTLMDLIDEKRDQLAEIIRAAMDLQLDDVFELPEDFDEPYLDERHNDEGVNDTLYALYRYVGLPGYLAKHAAKDARANAVDPFNPDWWTLHSGATYAVSHHSNAEAFRGSAMDGQVRTANDMLLNPPVVAEQVEQAYAEATADEETLADEAGGRARIVRDEDVTKAREQFERRAEEMQALVEPEA